MTVSVVIPVFRRQAEGSAAIRSALAQGRAATEIVVVDDGSPEPFSLEPDLAADGRVRLVRSASNRGAAAARNLGVREAEGEWIAFLDSDDLWLPGKLDAQLALAGALRERSALMTGFRQVELATGAMLDRIPVASSRPEDLAAGCWFAPGSTTLMRRHVFLDLGGFDAALERLEDLDFFLRLGLSGGGIEVTGSVLAEVRVGRRPDPGRLERANAALERKWLAGSDVALGQAARRNLSAYLALERASNRYHHGDPLGFAAALIRSLALAPRLRLHLADWWPARPKA